MRNGGDAQGLSPRMRGNRANASMDCDAAWSIPAYAGEPLGVALIQLRQQVYPRVCGGTAAGATFCISARGLSPRMRGNHPGGVGAARVAGSIPAYAGEPFTVYPLTLPDPVYPRVCGGTAAFRRKGSHRMGLSPRMRGNPRNRAIRSAAKRSIPAYAGEPFPIWLQSCWRRGLSPRMRGNRYRRSPKTWRTRSIPAYAGEPQTQHIPSSRPPVYPRVCGGTESVGSYIRR